MGESLGTGLPKQIERVAAKRERWLGYQRDMEKMRDGSGAGMGLTIAMMKTHLDAAHEAIASGDIAKMMVAYQDLADYSDDD
jgi:hypothetical protein